MILVGGKEMVDRRVSIWESRMGAHRSCKAMRMSLRRLSVERRGEEVGEGGAARVDNIEWSGGKRGVRGW